MSKKALAKSVRTTHRIGKKPKKQVRKDYFPYETDGKLLPPKGGGF